MEYRKIADLVSNALEAPDYSFRINYLLAGLMSAEANDTPEKEGFNNNILKNILDYLSGYSGDHEEYVSRICITISEYLENR